VLRIDPLRIAVERHVWDGTKFIPAATEKFERIGESWERVTPARLADEEPRDVRPAG
jgi:hypothetical protein